MTERRKADADFLDVYVSTTIQAIRQTVVMWIVFDLSLNPHRRILSRNRCCQCCFSEANREHVMKESQFSDAMRKRFGKPRHKADGNYWQGVGLKTTTHQPNVDPEAVL